MKKFQRAFLLCVCAIFLAAPISAHSGRTDASGGHKDNKNVSGLGPYHYHHGYEAHLHPGGVCPYDTGVGITNIDDPSSDSSNNYPPSTDDTSNITREDFDQILEHPTIYFNNPNAAQDSSDVVDEYYNAGYYNGRTEGYRMGVSEGEKIWKPKLEKASEELQKTSENNRIMLQEIDSLEKNINLLENWLLILGLVTLAAIFSAIRSKKKLAKMLSQQKGDQDAVS